MTCHYELPSTDNVPNKIRHVFSHYMDVKSATLIQNILYFLIPPSICTTAFSVDRTANRRHLRRREHVKSNPNICFGESVYLLNTLKFNIMDRYLMCKGQRGYMCLLPTVSRIGSQYKHFALLHTL